MMIHEKRRHEKEQVSFQKIKRLIKKVDELKGRLLMWKLRKAKARVDEVHIDGVNRTKDDILHRAVKELFQANNFEQVIVKAHDVKKRLELLGAFKHISIFIDTSKGENASSHGFQVIFHVLEAKRLTGGINTQVGNNDGSVVLGMRLPNMLGRGEALQGEWHYGTKHSSGFNATFTKPFLEWGNPRIMASIFQQGGDLPWSGYKQLDRGVIAQLMAHPYPKVTHTLQWEGIWRELGCLSQATSFDVREQAGHSLKSSLKHSVVIDTRDNPIIPNRGSQLKLSQEFAGVGGDVGFLKHEAEMQLNVPLFLDIVLQGSLKAGLIHPPFSESKYKICDRFFMGGPLNLRGFEMNGVGPHSNGNALGSDAYWSGGIHLYTPLPFRPGQGGIGDYFRTHFFADVGNIGAFSQESTFNLGSPFYTQPRWSFGIGLVLSIGHIARFELNYCFPRGAQSTDRAKEGLQFGIGITYL